MSKITKAIPKALAVLLLAASVTLGVCSTAQAAGWKTASGTTQIYSWLGIHDASLSVQGDYYTDGSRITSWGATRAYPNTYWPTIYWSGLSKGWTYQTSTYGDAYAHDTLNTGYKTQWITLTLESEAMTVYGLATR